MSRKNCVKCGVWNKVPNSNKGFYTCGKCADKLFSDNEVDRILKEFRYPGTVQPFNLTVFKTRGKVKSESNKKLLKISDGLHKLQKDIRNMSNQLRAIKHYQETKKVQRRALTKEDFKEVDFDELFP